MIKASLGVRVLVGAALVAVVLVALGNGVDVNVTEGDAVAMADLAAIDVYDG